MIRGRRGFIVGILGAAAGTTLLAACQPPQTIEKVVEKPVEVTKVVEQKVEKAVEVTRVVEKQVEKQVVITATAKPRERIEIHFQNDWLAEGVRAKAMDQAMELWRKQHPNWIIIPNSAQEDMARNIAADVMPDAMKTGDAGPSTLKLYVPQGIFQDITSVFTAKNYDFSDFVLPESFYKFQGKCYGLPFESLLNDWAANRTLLENAGVALPDMQKWTYDDIVEIGRQVTKSDKAQWGVDWSGQQPLWMPAIWSYGTTLFTPDGQKTLVGEGPAVDAWIMLTDWTFRWKIAPTPQTRSTDKLSWANGNYGLGIDRARGLRKFQDVQMLPPINPKTGLRYSQLNGSSDLVTAWAKKRDVVEQAAEVVIHFASKEFVQIALGFETGQNPIRISGLQSDLFAPKATRDVALESNKYRRDMEYERTSYWRAWRPAIQAVLVKMYNGELPVKEALAQVTQVGNKALAGG